MFQLQKGSYRKENCSSQPRLLQEKQHSLIVSSLESSFFTDAPELKHIDLHGLASGLQLGGLN